MAHINNYVSDIISLYHIIFDAMESKVNVARPLIGKTVKMRVFFGQKVFFLSFNKIIKLHYKISCASLRASTAKFIPYRSKNVSNLF